MKRFRLTLAIVGFAVALVGIVRDDRRISAVAIVILLISLILRLLARRREP